VAEKNGPLFKLGPNGRIYVGIAVSQGDRGQAVDEVDVFVTVNIPDDCSFASLNKKGETPNGYWVLLLLNVWLPNGIDSSDRLRRISEL